MTFEEMHKRFEEYNQKLEEYKSLIRNAKGNYNLLLKLLREMYQYVREIAPTFYKTEYGTIDDFYEILIKQVKNIENMVPSNYFIIPSDPSFSYTNNEPQKPISNDPQKVLDWLVYVARHRYASMSVYHKETTMLYSSFENKCTDMSNLVKKICMENGIACQVVRINPGFEETARLYDGYNYHDVCIVTLNESRYLVDCTYRQFFMLKGNSLTKIGIPFLSGTKLGVFMTMSQERMSLAQSLLKKRWIALTPENIKNYFDGFALSYRNGHYYEQTGDYSYTTNYSAADFKNFLEGTDSQVKHEGERVLKKQITISGCRCGI